MGCSAGKEGLGWKARGWGRLEEALGPLDGDAGAEGCRQVAPAVHLLDALPAADEPITALAGHLFSVAQVSKPAVLPTSKSAGLPRALRVWKPAIQQVWKPALRSDSALALNRYLAGE